MELEGQIEEIIYKNDNNDYTIAVFLSNSDNEVITVVGYLPFVAIRRLFKIARKNGNASGVW